MCAAAVGAGTGIYIFSTAQLRGIRYFAYSFFAIAGWAFANSVELMLPTLEQKVLLTKISYFGIVATTPLLFNFAAEYTGHKKYISFNWQALIWTVPVILIFTAFSNEHHYLHWKSYRLTDSLAGRVVYYESGPGVFLTVAYSYLMMTVSYVFLISYFIRAHNIYKKQIFLLLFSLFIPWALNFTYITRINPVPELDLAPVGVIISYVIILTAIWRFRLLKLLPHAKDLLFNSIPDPIFVVDNQLIVTDFNPAAKKMMMRADMVGASFSVLLPELNINPELSFDGNREYSNKSGEGVSWYDVSFSAIRSSSGIIEGHLVLLRNITKRKINEEKIQESERKLRELNANKDKFFSIISHDLKNPFSNLMNISRILQEDRTSLTEEESDNFINLIFKISHNSYELLENLLQWSRSQTGSISFLPEPAEISDIIDRATEEVKYNAENKKITIIKPDNTAAKVYCDQNMIAVVLRNILMNAIKFSYPGGKVEINCENREKDCVVSIRDNGTGMSEQVLNALFKIGYNSSRSGTANEQGTGLGLILCKEFVEKNGGEIWVESEQGKGSVFYMTLNKAGVN